MGHCDCYSSIYATIAISRYVTHVSFVRLAGSERDVMDVSRWFVGLVLVFDVAYEDVHVLLVSRGYALDCRSCGFKACM